MCNIPSLIMLLAWPLACAALADTGPRSNVLIVMPDDLSYDDFSYYNADASRTPHLDSLARESVRLTDFHVSPTCSPTRAALLTGRYSNSVGAWHTIMGRHFLRPGEITMAEVFKANGYATALFGKWHLGDHHPFRPTERGFEHSVMIRGGGIDQQPQPWGSRNLSPASIFVDDQQDPQTGDNAFITDIFTSRAIAYMRKCASSAKPFFVYLPYNVAHLPHDMPRDARPGVDALTGSIENVDANIGRILKFLKDDKLADNTLVFFLTDNGMKTSGLRGGKASPLEAGHRVPCFFRWPGGGFGGSPATARDVRRLAAHVDLLPTLMDLLGLHDVANRPADLAFAGKSIRTLLDADPANDRADLTDRIVIVDNQRLNTLTKYRQGCVMRDELDASGKLRHQWRLMTPNKSAAWELYDVLADPKQSKNLAGISAHVPLIGSMKSAYERWWQDVARRAGEYSRPIIGSLEEPAICLYSHDWHTEGDVPWGHSQIAGGMPGNGFNAVEFARSGTYTFELRRWPRELESETTLTSALKTALHGTDLMGKALPIRSARIRIWNGGKVLVDERKDAVPDKDAVTFELPIPAGQVMVQTWFHDSDGNEICGAYYVFVEPVEPATSELPAKSR